MARKTQATRGVTKRKPPKKEKKQKPKETVQEESRSSAQSVAKNDDEASDKPPKDSTNRKNKTNKKADKSESKLADKRSNTSKDKPAANPENAAKKKSEVKPGDNLGKKPEMKPGEKPGEKPSSSKKPEKKPGPSKKIEDKPKQKLEEPPVSRPPSRPESYDATRYTRAGTERRLRAAQRRRSLIKRWIWRIVIAIIVLAIVVAGAFFAWNRWFRYDDAADLQGNWQVDGTTTSVVIDAETMHITDDVAYEYTIDPESKTITYTFGTMEGQGRYRFSSDRSQVAIVDGDSFSWWSTLFEDIGWSFGQTIDSLQGDETDLSDMEADENTTVFDRVS